MLKKFFGIRRESDSTINQTDIAQVEADLATQGAINIFNAISDTLKKALQTNSEPEQKYSGMSGSLTDALENKYFLRIIYECLVEKGVREAFLQLEERGIPSHLCALVLKAAVIKSNTPDSQYPPNVRSFIDMCKKDTLEQGKKISKPKF